eukprot:m51a1_g12342 hypothetical protein (553) ;mRNA; r:512680-514852
MPRPIARARQVTKKAEPKKRQLCVFFMRFGKCTKQPCPFVHDRSKVAVCRKFLQGKCHDAHCPLQHVLDRPDLMPTCKFFLGPGCTNEHCPYRHVKVNERADVCSDFIRGWCERGTACKLKHIIECPDFHRTGKCPNGDACKLPHVPRPEHQAALQGSAEQDRQQQQQQAASCARKADLFISLLSVTFDGGALAMAGSFKCYTSFESITQRDIDTLEASGSATRDVWVATEKCHGANFSLLCTSTHAGVAVTAAKRKAVLRSSDHFFDFEAVLTRYTDAAKRAFELVRSRLGQQVDRVQIYGELIGGAYPHHEVPAAPGAVAVQREVFYCPQNEFYAFDIRAGNGFLDFDVALEVLGEAGFFCAQPLAMGTLRDCLSHPCMFPTTIPAVFGLPPIEGNTCEGLVIKRVHRSRPIFKYKNERFVEITGGACREQAQQQHAPQASMPPSRTPAPAEGGVPWQDMMHTASCFVNRNRLCSVVSKVGQVGRQDSSRLVNLLCKDALVDYIKSCQGAVPPREALREVSKSLESAARQVVSAYLAEQEQWQREQSTRK